jgi:hypothetical protein
MIKRRTIQIMLSVGGGAYYVTGKGNGIKKDVVLVISLNLHNSKLQGYSFREKSELH